MQMLDDNTVFTSISTFSGGGIGDLGIEWGQQLPVLSTCELLPDRAALIRHNFPDTRVFVGDIWSLKDDIIHNAQDKLQGKHPWLFVMSPPCQGMSSNGAGRISRSIKEGKRSREDVRNRLILPGLDIVEELLPDWLIIENVPRMENTIIRNEHDEPENILDLVGRRLIPKGYILRATVIDFAKLGVPHQRKRLITIGTRLPEFQYKLFQFPIYSKDPTILHPPYSHLAERNPSPISLREAIGHLPMLDSQSLLVDPADPLHCIPKWNDMHYRAMKHTPEGQTALHNNTCTHCQTINQNTDALCRECGEPLPKPLVVDTLWTCTDCGTQNKMRHKSCSCGFERTEDCPISTTHRVVKGFKTSYKRMKWDNIAGTITTNSGVISSDIKGHPEQHRVLSIRELLILSSIQSHPNTTHDWDGKYQFFMKPIDESKPSQPCTNKLIREIIGESIPPLAMSKIVAHLISLDNRFTTAKNDSA